MYMEAPVGTKDQGPMALWTAPSYDSTKWKRKAYTLVEQEGEWDKGGYSESSVVKHGNEYFTWFSGCTDGDPDTSGRWRFLQHKRGVNASRARARRAAPLSSGLENMGFAFSKDGQGAFTRSKHNPIGLWSESTPHMQAMAESKTYLDEAAGLVYVFHTVRWEDSGDFNQEDLGVEIFSPRPHFTVTNLRTLYGSQDEGLSVASGATTACKYERKNRRWCPPVKSRITAQGTSQVAQASVAYTITCACPSKGAVDLTLSVFSSSNGKSSFSSPSATHKVSGSCSSGEKFTGEVAAQQYKETWQQVKVTNNGAAVTGLEVAATLTA